MKLLVRALLHADRFHQPQYAPDYVTSTLDGNTIEDKISRFPFCGYIRTTVREVLHLPALATPIVTRSSVAICLNRKDAAYLRHQ